MYHSPSTQPLPEEESSTADEPKKFDKFGYLIVNNCWYEIPIGETKVGRDASLCSVVLDVETVSKVHAVFESEGAEDTFIYDAGSMNKTMIGKMKLKPHCRYKVNNNDVITLGGIVIIFKVINCKIKNSSESNTLQICSHDENSLAICNGLINSSLGCKMKNESNENSIKINEEIFKTPSMSVFKSHLKPVQKYYYTSADEDSPASDIFSQSTQCEVINTNQNNCFQSGNSTLKHIDDDDIYNLSTQCQYLDEFLKPKDKILERLIMKDTPSPKLEKTREKIDCDINESGTFDFMKGNKIRNCVKSYINDSIGEDIFDLATQYQPKSNTSVAKDELTFKNKINQPVNFGKSIWTGNSSEYEKEVSSKPEQEEEEKKKLMSLSDGDEDLCNLMRANSPLFTTQNSNSVAFKSNLIKTDVTDAYKEIFDVITQFPSKMTKKVQDGHSITDNYDHKYDNSNKTENIFDVVNNHYRMNLEEDKVLKSEVEFKKPGELLTNSITKGVPDFDEDMILTQVYSASYCISESKCVNQYIEEGMSVRATESGKSERRDNLEDLIATQVFEQGNHTTLLEKQNESNTRHFSQDDVATQVFPLGNESKDRGKMNEENQVLSLIIEEAPPKPVPDIVLLCDSGDETESDLEIKLNMECSTKKEDRKNSDVVKRDTEGSSPEPDVDERPSTAISDKTVSDLDIAELEAASSSLLERNKCEDFIATQMYPASSKEPKTNLPCERTNLNVEENVKYEDFISTQIFPMVKGRKSPSEISDKTESDFVVDTRPGGRYEITEITSEDDNCDIEDNSNESESLIKEIKEIEDFGFSSPVLCTVKRRSTPSPICQYMDKDSPALTPSHPVFEAMSEMDGLIVKTNDRSDSGIGAENIFDRGVPEKGRERSLSNGSVASDSDETDCEKELEVINRLGRQETFVISKHNTERGRADKTPLHSGDSHPSTSNSVPRRTVGGSNKTVGKSVKCGGGFSKNTKMKTPDTSMKSYFPPKMKEAMNSPLKRTLLMNSDEGIPKKRVRSTEARKKKEFENILTDEVILTQSLKLRNRVIRPKKTTPDCMIATKKTASEAKTHGRGRQKTSIGKATAIRKLVDDVRVLPEDSGKKSFRRRKSNGDDLKGIDFIDMKIVFTGFESDSHDRIIQKLGGERINHLDGGHILVTDRVRRTVKFLSAVALGLPIVSPKWLIASEKEMKFLNPWNFFLEDKPSEERWGFNLKSTVEKWRKQKLLKGYSVYATESTRPPVREILNIVRCCGGFPLTSCPDIWPEKSIVLTCVDDKKSWPPYNKFRQVKIVHFEFLLSGVLKHFMDFKTYKLR